MYLILVFVLRLNIFASKVSNLLLRLEINILGALNLTQPMIYPINMYIYIHIYIYIYTYDAFLMIYLSFAYFVVVVFSYFLAFPRSFQRFMKAVILHFVRL